MRNFFNRRTAFAALVFVLAVSSLAGYFAPHADALPSQEVWTEYYSDAAHTDLIGERFLLCNGARGGWGSTSSFAYKYSTPCWS